MKLPETHFAGYNLWFLKVTQYNRGRGIYVFKTLEQLEKQINELEEGVILQPNNAEVSTTADIDPQVKPDGTMSNVTAVPHKIRSSTFVIQKYIEKPLLINDRKFDIRVWVLLTHDLKLYFCQEGYIRTSCEIFSLENVDLDNPASNFVHLTNNAVQKYSQNYGKFEDGNQLSFDDFQTYIDEHYSSANVKVKEDIVNQMIEVIKSTFK